MSKPLTGVKVVDLTQVYNGPYATFLMAMAGAEVIKVEPPGGEHMRRRQRDGGGQIPFAMLNGGKYFVCLDLKTEDGKRKLEHLLADADIVVENFRPGVMQRLGFGDERLRAINSKLIRASSSGYGSSGKYKDFPALDLIVQAMSGVLSVTGYEDRPPVQAGAAICDFMAGIHLYAAAMTALAERGLTGKTRSVEVSMIEATYPSLASNLGQLFGARQEFKGRTGNRHRGRSLSPYNLYPAKDGFVAIIANNDAQFGLLVDYFGASEIARDPRFATVPDRVRNEDALDALITGWTRERPKEELFAELVSAGVPCAPVRELNEVVYDEELHARKALVEVDHPEFGRIVVQTSPLVFEGVARDIPWHSRAIGADQARYFD